MKKFFIAFSLIALMVGCAEDEIGQRATDGTPPKAILADQIKVVDVPGGADLVYTLPDDEDIAFVEATYTTNRGPEKTRSSVYNDTLKIRGYGDTGEKPVKLVVYDRSHNVSAPTHITISPQEPPLNAILNTIEMEPAFGGLRLTWENPTAASVVIRVYKKDKLENIEPAPTTYASAEDDDSKVDEDGNPKFYEIETLYTSRTDGVVTIRGQKDVEAEFAVVISDRWQNKTVLEDKVVTLTPIFEMRIPNNLKFTYSYRKGGDTKAGPWPHWQMTDDKSGDPNGFHTNEDSGPWPHRITTQFLKPVKLSRMKFYHRDGFLYKHGNPKQVYIYGYTKPEYPDILETDDLDWTDPTFEKVNEWVLLGVYNSIKPSGLEGLGEFTGEDKTYILAGEDFEFDINLPEVYYIKFVQTESWSGGLFMHIMETRFWGKVEGVTDPSELD